MKVEVIEKLASLMTAAFGLIAALAWNSAIQEIFNRYFTSDDTIIALLFYAVIVTIIAVFAAIYIGKAADKAKE